MPQNADAGRGCCNGTHVSRNEYLDRCEAQGLNVYEGKDGSLYTTPHKKKGYKLAVKTTSSDK